MAVTYTSREQIEVYRFSLPVAILVPLLAVFLQVFLPLRFPFFSIFDLPLLVVIFFAMARDGLLPSWAAKVHGKHRVPHVTTLLTGLFVAAWSLIGDAGETYDLTNIGTLFAFVLVCIGVLILRYTDPDRPRPFRVPLVWPVTVIGSVLCLYVMRGLPRQAWERFGWWLAIGLVLYFSFGFRNSTLRRGVRAELPDLPSPRPRERVP